MGSDLLAYLQESFDTRPGT